ncbi:MAG TPA: four helix bundle protein [Gemmatimonadales bacterium]|nr:four helix bundle protein [Gemmatimonadales bacterium]
MQRHTSLRAWQTARSVALGVFRANASHWRPWVAPAFEQVGRAALSVQLNIAEGYSFGRSASFTNHLRIAYGSAVETADLLEFLRELGAVTAAECDRLIALNRECQACIAGLLRNRNSWARPASQADGRE